MRFTLAVDPRELVLLRWRRAPGGRRPRLDQGLHALRSFVWLGAETFPNKKGNWRCAVFSERFPAITELRACFPFFRSSIVQEARPVRDHPTMFCALLWRDHRRQRLWMGLGHTT